MVVREVCWKGERGCLEEIECGIQWRIEWIFIVS